MDPGTREEEFREQGLHAGRALIREVAMKTLHKRCAGLDVHKAEVVACVRLISKRKVEREVRRSRRRHRDYWRLPSGWRVQDARTWRWRRRACTGSRSGTFWKGGLHSFWRMPRM